MIRIRITAHTPCVILNEVKDPARDAHTPFAREPHPAREVKRDNSVFPGSNP